MTVGIVIVSHSSRIAEGIVELAGQMADAVRLIPAGGMDDGSVGTSFDKVSTAIAEADDGGGVIVLCDLGSAILTAETALDFLDDDVKERVLIVDAPIVEGAVTAAVTAQTGGDLAAVAAAARTAWEHGDESAPDVAADVPSETGGAEASVSRTTTLVNKDGLHARPAAEFVKLATTFASTITVNRADAKSMLRVMALGATSGTPVTLEANGADARDAVDALARLIESGFGET